MCGIAGYIGPRRLDDVRVERCLSLMGRRGPDSADSYHHVSPTGRHVHLLHTRLTVIDLGERSNQPFRVGSSVLAYNGELYSYVEQAERLRSKGVTLTTTGDTEVMARTLVELGVESLDDCEGMWAFAQYDERTGDLLLSRDRFGEKPLYVYEDADGTWFASEPKMIAALRDRPLQPDLDHLRRYLVNGYKSLYKVESTFFESLRELPIASCRRYAADGTSSTWRYWEPSFAPDDGMTYAAAVDGARERLIESVRLRLRADVPLAFCMSGGVDSNALISIAKRVLGFDVHGFTIVNTDERYEEQDLIEASVRELGIRHTSVPLRHEGFLRGLRELVRYHDAPVYTVTYYAHWLLEREIAEAGYRISISGTAADELFTGYFDHHVMYLAAVRDDPDLHARSLAAWRQHVQPLVRNPYLSDPHLFVRDPGFRDHIYLHADELAANLRAPWSEPFRERRFTDELLRNRMLNELFEEAVPVILHEDDGNAMYHSIENRSPFLDRRLFEHCQRIPTRHLVRDGRAKAVLRDAVRGIAPDIVVDNPRKVGFNAPLFDFLDRHDPATRAEVLNDSPIWEHVRKDAVEALLDCEQLPNSESKFLFSFLNAKLFLEELG